MDGYALIDQPRSGAENMALDQQLLETAARSQSVWLRVYRWSEPTLSLGYFQPYAQRLDHQPSSSIPVVRRATGGGAIVHHYDWTYCVAVPQDWLSRSGQGRGSSASIGASTNAASAIGASAIGASQPLYDLLHDAVVQWLNEIGFAVRKWSVDCELARPPLTAAQRAAFLCFERRSCGDVVWADRKVMGSAQRRLSGAILQHGSLLLSRSPHAPSLPGLSEDVPQVDSQSPAADSIKRELLGGSATRLMPPALLAEAHELFTPEVFLQRLVAAVESAAEIKLDRLQSLVESPVDWNWPKASCFAETKWTQRV